MPKIRFSRLAETDLEEIALYTFQTRGDEQTRRYLNDLREFIERLDKSPLLGRFDSTIDGCRRIECGKHVVFYRIEDSEVLILRVLHQKMLPDRYEMTEE